MSAFIEKIKAKTHRKSPSAEGKAPETMRKEPQEEQRFGILPHPAKTNDPADLQGPTAPGGGLRSDPVSGAHHAHGPVVPNSQMLAEMEKPMTHGEARARTLELNLR